MTKISARKKQILSCRAAAASVIASVIQQHASLATLLPNALEKTIEKDKSLLQEICYGSLRHYFSLSYEIENHLAKPLRQKDQDIMSLLIAGAYQLRYMRIPDYAAINSTVNAADELNKSWAKALINAVLRKIQKQILIPPATSLIKNEEAHYDHPQWLIELIRESWPEQTDSILFANNTKSPMTLRVNALQQSCADYLILLKNLSIAAVPTAFSNIGIRLESPIDVDKLPGFFTGSVSVQDEAAQLTAPLLKPENQHSILDACAAPGGKTCHILELAPNAQVIALDIDECRSALIRENLQRLQLNAKVVTADACNVSGWWNKHCGGKYFDRILVDAPCSATGVIRHHPDIKLLRQSDDIANLAKLQLEILTNLWPLLKPGGILLYTTCSLLKQENDDVIADFLLKTDNATVDAINETWGISTLYGKQLLPQIDGHDGFYFCRIKKR